MRQHYHDYMPRGLSVRDKLWWWLMPGVVIKVRWPVGEVRIQQEPSGVWDYVKSSDPNDHYRPWMEANVGRQKWDWDWGFAGNDVSDNCLTIKIRQSRREYATIALMRWS